MDYAGSNRKIGTGKAVFSQFRSAVAYALVFCLRRLRCWRDARHLKDLPDYLLKDIGIERDQVAKIEAGLKPARDREITGQTV